MSLSLRIRARDGTPHRGELFLAARADCCVVSLHLIVDQEWTDHPRGPDAKPAPLFDSPLVLWPQAGGVILPHGHALVEAPVVASVVSRKAGSTIVFHLSVVYIRRQLEVVLLPLRTPLLASSGVREEVLRHTSDIDISSQGQNQKRVTADCVFTILLPYPLNCEHACHPLNDVAR
eukprot:SAG31_NODE_63_length_28659_cov_23.074685_7_plen_176_part_00